MSDGIAPETKAEIAHAVRQALAEHGYERLTTAKIADKYAKSEAGLYYYYDTKDEMIAAFLEETAGTVGERLATVDGGPEQRLREACAHLFVDPGDEAAGVHVAIMELLSHAPYNDTLREQLLALESATLEFMTGIVREGVEQGVFREVNPRETAAFLLAAADGSTGFYVALEMDVGEDLHAGVSAYIDSLLAA